jgi:uncharacterized 2Fe-2S/4Fe-4S cluster protein (DUF4445 family)
MDIGTNTELIVGNKHKVLAASCPAGPAFEGGPITHGLPGLPGAMEDVKMDDDGAVHVNVIGGGEFVVAPGGDETITFNESDINFLAQAKGANVAGLQIAFAEYGINYTDLGAFYLAGGFGRHLDVESSKRIGLIPNIPAAKLLQVGNASVEGACIALLSRAKRAELEQLVRRVTHCRLETHPGFFDYFVEGCQFAPVGGSMEVGA